MAAFNKFNSFVEALGQKKHNLNADTLKVMLSNVAPIAANAVKADLTEIAAGFGYVAGGNQVGSSSFAQVAGVATLLGDDVQFVAAGGAIGPFRYAILYNDSALNDELIGWWDNGAPETLSDGENFNVRINDVTGAIQVT